MKKIDKADDEIIQESLTDIRNEIVSNLTKINRKDMLGIEIAKAKRHRITFKDHVLKE